MYIITNYISFQLPFGMPPIIHDLSERIGQLLDCPDQLPIHDVSKSQRLDWILAHIYLYKMKVANYVLVVNEKDLKFTSFNVFTKL